MDPVTLGVVVAALAGAFFTKLAEKAGEKTGDQAVGAVGKLVDWLKGRFSADEVPNRADALAKLEDVPDSARLKDGLAKAITERAQHDPAFKADLEELVSQARDAGANVDAITQRATGTDINQLAGIDGSTIVIGDQKNTGRPPLQDGTTQQGTGQ